MRQPAGGDPGKKQGNQYVKDPSTNKWTATGSKTGSTSGIKPATHFEAGGTLQGNFPKNPPTTQGDRLKPGVGDTGTPNRYKPDTANPGKWVADGADTPKTQGNGLGQGGMNTTSSPEASSTGKFSKNPLTVQAVNDSRSPAGGELN